MIKLFSRQYYIKELLILLFCYFLTEGIFSWLIVPNSAIYQHYEKFLSLGIFTFMVLSFPELKKDEKIVIGLFSVLFLKLVIQSLIVFNSIFEQFTIFTVIYPVVFATFIKFLLRSYDLDLLSFMVKFYLVTYIIFMIIYGRQFSLGLTSFDLEDYGPFSGDSRIIHARSVFMIIVPYLWYLHHFLNKRKTLDLLLLLFSVLIIILHQHRSVWGSAIFASGVYFLLVFKNNPHTSKKITGSLAMLLPIALIGAIYVTVLYPKIFNFFTERFDEILNPSREGSTGNFRIEQSSMYWEYIKQRPIFGWSFEGFNLPNPLVDWWEDNSGHHFHEGFIEILFYHGFAGLLLKYGLLIVLMFRAIRSRISDNAIILVAFCISGAIFSLSYVLPLIFWGHVGMCFYYLEKNSVK